MDEIPHLNLINLILWLLRGLQRFRIKGNSMLPLLQPNDEVLVDTNIYKSVSPSIGDIVVIRHPHKPDLQIIKRITKINESGEFFVEGDNVLASTDSRTFGFIKANLIIGKVVCFFP